MTAHDEQASASAAGAEPVEGTATANESDGARKEAGPAPESPPDQITHERVTLAYNAFNGPLLAPGSVFGIVGENAETPGRATGTMRAKDIEAALSHYVEPPPYASALRSLVADRMIVLTGPPGIGKHAAAISLARQITDAPLIVLSPVITLTELADERRRPYTAGHAYLVIDWQGEQGATDTDFRLGLVREAVAAAGALLILTCSAFAGGDGCRTVHQVAWRCPDPRKIVRAYGDDAAAGTAALDAACAVLPPEASLADLIAFARRIAAGDPPEVAAEVFDIAVRRTVRAWFDDDTRTAREVLEVAALAFVLGVSERRFESLLARLEQAMAPVPVGAEPAPDGGTGEEGLPQLRALRGAAGGLIRVDRVATETAHRRVPVFARPAYRRQVLIELWERYPVAFWNAVRDWLDVLVQEEDSLAVAQGVALFAHVDLDEVRESYLDPWSITWPKQLTAAYVLWFMCRDALAPLALRIATQWAAHGSSAQRGSASIAFSGELGRRYPVEAAKRLWQLIVQGDDRGAEEACTALAGLYATLVDGAEGAGVVLAVLDRQLGHALTEQASRRRRTRTVRAALAVLSVADRRTGHSSVLVHLCRQPDRTETVARLWAGVLRHRGFRRRALQALLHGLRSLGQLSARPAEDARVLGEALGAVLPEFEAAALKRDFITLQANSRRTGDAELARALLTALERIHHGATQ